MKKIQTFTEYNHLNEGWKENVLAAISLASSVAGYSQKIDTGNKPDTGNKTEMTVQDTKQDKMVWSACFQLCQEMKSGQLSFTERRGIAEAQMYFQAKRDGKSTDKLSKEGEAAVKSILKTVQSLDSSRVKELASKGSGGDFYAEFTGK